jgi:hypothetical protein
MEVEGRRKEEWEGGRRKEEGGRKEGRKEEQGRSFNVLREEPLDQMRQ